MSRKDISGIYKITNPNEAVYIGRSYRVKERLRAYRRLDCKGQHAILASLNKYGVQNHTFEVLHYLPNDVEQSIIEQYEVFYINQYKECGFRMLNIAPGGKGAKRLTKEQKEKAGIVHKNKTAWNKGQFGFSHNRSVPVVLNGICYGSISEASRATGIAISSVHYKTRTKI